MSAPSVEILAVGTELLLHGRRDTNSAELSSMLGGMGFAIRRRMTLGDDLQELKEAFREAAARSDLIVSTGGLGPTADDRTREALAAAFGRELREEAALVRGLEERFSARSRPMPRSNLVQALVPEGAEVLPNPEGTAPGLWLSHPTGVVTALPGPPVEMRAVLNPDVLEKIQRTLQPAPVARRCVLTSGLGESDLEDRIGDVYELRSEVTVTVLASPGLVEVLLLARHEEPGVAEEAVGEVAAVVEQRLQGWVFATKETTLAAHVGQELRAHGRRVAVAESCTAGLLGARLTAVPGSADYFLGGIIAYADTVKREMLGVPASVLESEGAVSEATASAMADGVRTRLRADHGLAITGVAGPTGGTESKPVGTVCIAVADAEGGTAVTRRFHGSRDRVREWSVAGALHLLRGRLPHPGRP